MSPATTPPNIVVVVADDHAAQALSAYDDALTHTPNLDRMAAEGMRLDACFCTNSICSPSRAAMLTGTHNHVNGVTTLATHFDNRQPTFATVLQAAGWATGLIGKWHLGHGPAHDPRGFDEWTILHDQGEYHDPLLLHGHDGIDPVRRQGPEARRHPGYVTEVLTDLALDFIDRQQDPFCLLLHHKAPHRPWNPEPGTPVALSDAALPASFDDDHVGQAPAAAEARMGMEDLGVLDLKVPVPGGLAPDQEREWRWRRFLADYLACVDSIDVQTGRLLDHLDATGRGADTVVVYTSDQGFFLGEHGWFDKRFIYEESLRMPLLVRWPAGIAPGSTCSDMVLNVDLAPTVLDLAGLAIPDHVQGRSIVALLRGESPPDWRTSMYYRYWMHLDSIHRVQAHRGVRTQRHKLVRWDVDGAGQPGASEETRPPAWELFDLEDDPFELRSVADDPGYAQVRQDLEAELARLEDELGVVDPVQPGGLSRPG